MIAMRYELELPSFAVLFSELLNRVLAWRWLTSGNRAIRHFVCMSIFLFQFFMWAY